jgi:SPP1 family predicted phage head-tail adaptor
MTLAAGPMDQRVQIQQRLNSTQNELGENTTPWTTLATVWASAEPLRGREYFAAGQQQQVLDVRFVIRYRSDVNGTMRIVWRGQPHDIVGQPINVDGRREKLELMTVAGVRDGR